MDFHKDNTPHLYLTFHEANILIENLRTQDKAGFIQRLANLSQHTPDPVLRHELTSLNDKILELSEREFATLRQDVLSGKVLFPPNYPLPKFTE